MPPGAHVDAAQLARLRRDLKKVSPDARKALDREIKAIGRASVVIAARLSTKDSGAFAAAWKVSLTQASGVAVRNAKPQARQQEFGGQVWLQRGLPHHPTALPKNTVAGGAGRGVMPVRQRQVGGGLVVDQARYLIKRTMPGHRAVDQQIYTSRSRVEAAMRASAERSLS